MTCTVESCAHIQIHTLKNNIKDLVKKYYPDATDEEMHQHILDELGKITVNDQSFEYDSQPNYLGGYRWFFLCPRCKQKANKLFLPPITATDREQKYLCKICHKLKNQSAIMGQNKTYKRVTRPLRRMKQIEDRLVRGYLSEEKIREMLIEYETLESNMKSSPEYRLFAFKKKHNLL